MIILSINSQKFYCDESVPLQSHASTDDFPSDGLPNDENRTHEHICLPITPGYTTGLAEGLEITDSEEVKIKNAFEKLTTILQSDSPKDLQQLLEELTMINMTDVGGQPAFLDMLPALTIGPALYFLFFRLDQELGKHYPVQFCTADDKQNITLESLYCIKEVLHQC